MPDQICENAGCSNSTASGSVFDHYFKKRICAACFQKNFDTAQVHAFGEWWEKNYNQADYPPEFWRSVGAFIDLSKTVYQDPYK